MRAQKKIKRVRRTPAQAASLRATIARMAQYDATEIEPNVFRPLTLTEIGTVLGITREYVRQVLASQRLNVMKIRKRAAQRGHAYRKALEAARYTVIVANGSKTHRSEYNMYRNMLTRCFNPNSPNYPRYGGRGVTVCERWLGKFGFQHFMQGFGRFNPNVKGKRAKFSIHRINNVPLYSPETVKWATSSEQCAPGQRGSQGTK